jgi:hypothetical protein
MAVIRRGDVWCCKRLSSTEIPESEHLNAVEKVVPPGGLAQRLGQMTLGNDRLDVVHRAQVLPQRGHGVRPQTASCVGAQGSMKAIMAPSGGPLKKRLAAGETRRRAQGSVPFGGGNGLECLICRSKRRQVLPQRGPGSSLSSPCCPGDSVTLGSSTTRSIGPYAASTR